MEEARLKNEYYGFVYITTNLVNGKIYVGKKQFHKDWKTYLGSGITIKKAIKKYGRDSFLREILVYCKDFESLNRWEIFYISLLGATDKSIGYNISLGGEGANGVKRTETQKKHLSLINTGKKQSQETKDKRAKVLLSLNRKLSQAHKDTLSESLKGNCRRFVSIELINMSTGITLEIKTLKEAANFLQTSDGVLLRYLQGYRKSSGKIYEDNYKNHIYKGYLVKYK